VSHPFSLRQCWCLFRTLLLLRISLSYRLRPEQDDRQTNPQRRNTKETVLTPPRYVALVPLILRSFISSLNLAITIIVINHSLHISTISWLSFSCSISLVSGTESPRLPLLLIGILSQSILVTKDICFLKSVIVSRLLPDIYALDV
jgi:hypothetical protein